MNTNNQRQSDERFDPLAVALRTEAALIKAPVNTEHVQQRILAELDRPLAPQGHPLAFPILASLASAALVAICVLPFVDHPASISPSDHGPSTAVEYPAPVLPSLPAFDVQNILAVNPAGPLDQEVANVADDLARVSTFIRGILPSNPSPLPLL